MAGHKVLVVEDEKMISDVITSYLEREGMEVSVAATGGAALSLISEGYDLVILDLRLPDMDGESVCSAVREVSDIPIIMLTAKSSEDDRVKGLGMGADDYVVKPFSSRELVARVKAHLRRAEMGDRRVLSFNRGTLTIDTQTMEVRSRGRVVPLTATEFRILLSLAEKPKIVFSRLQLINMAQGLDFDGFDRVIDAHIKNIRHKIEENAQSPEFIRTVYGVGYRFAGEPDL